MKDDDQRAARAARLVGRADRIAQDLRRVARNRHDLRGARPDRRNCLARFWLPPTTCPALDASWWWTTKNARAALAELLADEGFDVATAADAFEALGTYDSFAPHLVITDLKMPGMDGLELVQKLRSGDDPPATAGYSR